MALLAGGRVSTGLLQPAAIQGYRGPMQRPNHSEFAGDYVLPLVGTAESKSLLAPFRDPKIRAPPVDDVNNLRHDC
jgi:hypothetical protein